MGQFNQMSIIEAESTQTGFVPHRVVLNGQPASLDWWRNAVGVTVVGARRDGSMLTIQLSDDRQFKCKVTTFGGVAFPPALLEAVRWAYTSGHPVDLCVGVGPNGKPATGYFCGLAPTGKAAAASNLAGRIDI